MANLLTLERIAEIEALEKAYRSVSATDGGYDALRVRTHHRWITALADSSPSLLAAAKIVAGGYVAHKPECADKDNSSMSAPYMVGPCTCGLSALLSALGKES